MIILPFRPDASWRHPPMGTFATMLALLLIHIAWGRCDPEALRPYLLDFQAISPLQWLTSGLLHAGWMHLIGNLVFLYVFGAIVEDFLGRWFVPVYLLLTIASGALEQLLLLLMHHTGFALGASAAIYGLITLAVLWAPRTRVSTLVWLLVHRPQVVEIRVLWLAGGYMAMEILGVWLQGGTPSSEFLHTCGIVVGLPLGLLCLRERWIDTLGGDLLAPDRPHAATQTTATPQTATAGVAWDEQAGRLTAALAAGDRRLALAAYEVLRREHPNRIPEAAIIEHLLALCEEDLDFHRAVAIGERAVSAGTSTNGIHLRLARIHGQHLGDVQAGIRHLDRVHEDGFDGEGRAVCMQMRARFECRLHSQRQTRKVPVAVGLLIALLPVAAAEFDASPQNPFAPKVAANQFKPALDPVEPRTTTGLLPMAGGASISLPKGFVYITWHDLGGFLALPPADPKEDLPLGLILSDEQLDLLSSERAGVPSREAWEASSAKFLVWGGAVQVHWEDGWIDTSEALPAADALLRDFQANAQLLNRRHAFGRGVGITIDGWLQQPGFIPKAGILSWAFQGGIGAATVPGATMSGMYIQSAHLCHLGASGTLHLVCDGKPVDAEPAERLREISAHVRWETGRGFAAKQPDGVGERTGGFRRLMLPRVVFGDPAEDRLVYRNRGLGLAWLLILLPMAVMGWIVLRRLRASSRAEPLPIDAVPRCQACGSPAPSSGTRCPACGRSLVR